MTQTKAPIWFWIIGVIALVWNGLGVAAYIGEAMMTAEQFAGLSELERNLYANRPSWVTAAFAIAVIGGFVAAITLLLRKAVSVRLFFLSLVAVVIQFSSYFVLDGYAEYIAETGWAMPIMIPLFAVGFFLFARWCEKNEILA